MAYTCIVTQMSKRSTTTSPAGKCCLGIEEALQTKFFKALCDPCRVSILICLARAGEPSTVSEAAASCPCDMSVVSRHLATLREAGILDCEKRGKQVYYSVRFAEFVSTLRCMADAIEACCGSDKPDRKGNLQ